MSGVEPRASLTRYAWLSVGAALTTIALKSAAYGLTRSVALLSDALESLVNLVAAVIALVVLRVAEAPADDEHEHGHEKVEYFSSGFEGALIFAAAIAIVVAAVQRILEPRPLAELGVGLVFATAASVVNLAVARLLLRASKRHRSIVLEADGHHLMTDVWTSVAVLAGLGVVALTGLSWLDPVLAILMAALILRTGGKLLYRSGMGLLDAGVPRADRERLEALLDGFRTEGMTWHALRTRQSGTRRFISVHVLVPGDWSVQRGHDLLERIEAALRTPEPKTTVITHLEPIEDPCAYQDLGLDRTDGPAPRA